MGTLSGPAPFFVVGNDRSGTTMLRLVLDRGPEAAIPPESMFLGDFIDQRRAPEPNAQELMRRVWRHPKVRLWDLPGPVPTVPPGLAGPDAFRWVMEAPFRAYAQREGKPRWGDKTPWYLHLVDPLLEVWPEARFVVLVRDGRDVFVSIRPLPFGPNNAWAAAEWWARGIRAGQRAQREHPDRVLTVRYEDLVADPTTHVPAICAWVGLRYDPEMLAIERAERTKVVSDQASWFRSLWAGINTSAVERWRTVLTPREQATFAALAGPELRALGYEAPEGVPPPTPEQERRYRLHNEALRNWNFVRLRVGQERGRELGYALRRKLERRRARRRA